MPRKINYGVDYDEEDYDVYDDYDYDYDNDSDAEVDGGFFLFFFSSFDVGFSVNFGVQLKRCS